MTATYVFLGLLVAVVVWRFVLPGVRMEKARTTGTSTPTAAARAPTAAPSTRTSMKGWLANNLWTILLVLVGAAIFYFGVYTSSSKSPNLTDVGNLSWDHWLPIFVLWGIGAILIALNAGAAAKASQWVLAGVMFALFVGVPAWSWITSPPVATPQRAPTRSEIPLASSPQSTWPKLTIPAGGKSERIPLPLGMRYLTVIGNDYQLYSVYQDLHECSSFGKETCPGGAVMEYYVTNDINEENIILYAFVPK